MKFDVLKIEQCDFVYQMEKDIFPDSYSLESLLYDCSNPLKRGFVLIEDETIVAYMLCSTVLDEINIDRIAVEKDYRKRGLASYLLQSFINYCRDNGLKIINLEVRSSNDSAIGLYEKFGFKRVGERKNYYHDNNEDAMLYTLIIEGQ